MNRINQVLPYLSLSLIIIIVFFGLTGTFYQQDEWYGLGDILALGSQSIFSHTSLIGIILGQGRIFGDLIIYFLIGKFPFNILPIALFAITFHTLNTLLTFVLIKKITKKVIPAFLGALFFGLNAVSAGAVTWAASGSGTLPATTLIIISILSYLKLLETRKKKWVFLSLISLYFSLYFKEIGIFLFLLYPLYHLLFHRTKIKEVFWINLPFVLFFLVNLFFVISEYKSIPVQKDLFLTGSSNSFFLTLIVRAIMYPLTSFSLIFIPSEIMFYIAKRITWVYYPFFPSSLYDLVAQSAMIDIIAVIFSLGLIFLLFVLSKKFEKPIRNLVIFFVGFIILGFIPYIIIGKSNAYLENRYYYLAALGWGSLLGIILSQVTKFLRVKIVLVVGIVLLLITHTSFVKKEIKKQENLAAERLAILNQIIKLKPEIKQKSAFYLTGNRNFYISEGNSAPFQQGTGYTLLVWYYTKKAAPLDLISLIKTQEFWGIGEQGYKKVGQVEYGYFWEIKKLSDLVKNGQVNPEDVMAFYYDSNTKTIKDITSEVKSKF